MKKMRVVIALAIFVLIGVQFVDIYHQLPKPYFKLNPTELMFLPSLSQMIATLSIAAGGAFLIFTIISLIFGRVYCSYVCPFGILMDIIRRIGLFPAKNPKLKSSKLGKFCSSRFAKMAYRPARNLLKIFFLSVAIIAMIIGFQNLLGFIEPYSLYGKIMGAVITPFVASVLNWISITLSNFGIYSIPPVDGDPSVSLFAFSTALLILLLISAASLLRGRIFCNTICPVGALLSFTAKFSLYKVRIDKSSCISCGLCERNCKAEAIDAKSKKIDFSKCVLCFNCGQNCPKKSIVFSVESKENPSAPKTTKKNELIKQNLNNEVDILKTLDSKKSDSNISKISRRTFPKLAISLGALLCSAAKKEGEIIENTKQKSGKNLGIGKRKNRGCSFEVSEDASAYSLEGNRPDKRLAAPPGAESIEKFLEVCTGCQICTAACKSQILKPSITQWGLSGFMQPFMDFSKGFCLYTCHSCSKVCPTGAIKFLPKKEKQQTKIGTAIFKKSLCVVKTDGTDCAACAEHCPVQAIEMLPFGKKEDSLYIPYVHEDVCIGCGACEYICPVTPHKAIVVQGIKNHKKAVIFEESMSLNKDKESSRNKPTDSTKDTHPSSIFPF